MFDIAKSISYRINYDDLKEAEMEIFKLEFDHEPATKMIELFIDDGVKIFKYIYALRNEFNKWYFVVIQGVINNEFNGIYPRRKRDYEKAY